MTNANSNVSKPSALDTLKAIAKKSPAPASSSLAAQTNDPAIIGAKRNKNTVTLGFDPTIAESAKRTAELKEALERAEAEFKIDQALMRDYGFSKRCLYNDTYKADVTTVCVPYSVETPTGHETKLVQVICSNKYSVQNETIANNKDSLGEFFDKLFNEDRVKQLKPNAEDLIRGILAEVGLAGEELETAMSSLFEEKVKITTKEHYEQEVKKVPEEVRSLLDQAVTRSAPGLKFP